ncbi:ATP-dependent protease La (LON) domain protein [Heracleum sosnowskyi]|uniref:Protein cereblon n=1 Tax=Heracleum sosnowskyi TaxID=360622 RepID=A0AAD8MFE8_9APIA|nr:ATP-dependent protease La (LON) domain protein [Heracleum sosnowskyi]
METDGLVAEMERYRELDSEELVIEEVESLDESFEEDNTEFDHGYGGAFGSTTHAFDPMWTSLHSHLGEVEVTQNRQSFLEGGAVLDIPLSYLEGEVLFPGQTLHLKVIEPKIIDAMERALNQANASYILGVVSVYRDSCNGEMQCATTGTTTEILQIRKLENGSLTVLTRGQQRFRLRGRWITVEGAPCGEIQIIHEDAPLRTPRDAVGKQAPLRNSHNLNDLQNKQNGLDIICDDSDTLSDDSFTSGLSPTERRLHESALASSSWCSKKTAELASDADESEFTFQFGHSHSSMLPSHHLIDIEKSENNCANKIISDIPIHEGVGRRKGSLSSLYQVSRAFWPSWVYHMYDSYCLAQKVAGMWEKIVKEPSLDDLLKNPDILSFHIASKLPVSVSTRQELLDIDGISNRLRREIELLESFNCIRCKNCQKVISKRSDMLVMSSMGPFGAYLNSSGYVHEIVTLLKVNGLSLVGHPSEEYSWFPGYAWTIAYCTNCECQMGWRFTATKKNLNLQSFWGIRSSQIAGYTC